MNPVRRSVAKRLSLIGAVALILTLTCITAVLTFMLMERAREQRTEWLLDRANGVVNAIDAVDLTSRTMVQRVFPVLAAIVGRDVALDAATGQLSAGGVALADNTEPVDRFTTETGGVATIFAKQADGYRRITTSLKKEDGSRAVGTLLDPLSPAYAAIAQDKPYTGRATLFGKAYMTRYEPLHDATGATIGILFEGFEIGTFDAAVEKAVAASRLFDSGGIYVIDPRGTTVDGAVFAIHPQGKGKKVLDVFADAKPFLQALASSAGTPVPSPGLYSTQGGDRSAVVRMSAATGQWVVAEISDSESMRSQWRTLIPFWILLAIACAGLTAGLLWLTRRQIGAPLEALSASARAVAAGDLTRSSHSDRPDEIGQVVRDVESMRLRFLSLLTTLRHSADSIANASGEIAAGNQDLSGRTEHSASDLQKTSALMGELTGTVTQTAESTRTARTLATSTLEAASQGAGVMSEMVATMGEINSSARKIADIIGVIDGISFQTNILALNAAVEAARAGEQGRGFAVVAGEVRSLAQRSATAAKEIKSLIEGSVLNVEAGSRLVQSAGSAMSDIQREVGRVHDIIGEISHAADDQSRGIVQVNSTVGELDRNTQQNAALVEQSAAAAMSLQEQARRLAAVLHEFDLQDGESAHRAAPILALR